MKRIIKDPATYFILILILLTLRSFQLHHYDVMVLWALSAAYNFYDFFIRDDKK